MGRPRKFSHNGILEQAMIVFWQHGYADTTVQDLEKATGVNKSGLYAEFEDKADLFIKALRFYYASETEKGQAILACDPPGWHNIEKFLKHVAGRYSTEKKGCFGVNSLRELERLPSEARDVITERLDELKGMFARNIAAENTQLPAGDVAELLSTFFSGFCINQNLSASQRALSRQIKTLMAMLKRL